MTCTRCRTTKDVKFKERLNPKNLRAVRLPLCDPCAKLLGYHPIDFRYHASSLYSLVGPEILPREA